MRKERKGEEGGGGGGGGIECLLQKPLQISAKFQII